jgi:phosphomannomutase
MISTSGVRGVVGHGLDPVMVTEFAAAFGTYLKRGPVVIGRDSRPSGQIIKMAAIAGLRAIGIDVIDIGIVPTPTVELAVPGLKASGGICITASHNPAEWNALKFFNHRGEFIDRKFLKGLIKIRENNCFDFKPYRTLGSLKGDNSWLERHIKAVLRLPEINRTRIKRAKLKAVVDAVNSAGSLVLPQLLEELGVEVVRLNCENDGNFVRGPEPVPKNLKMLGAAVRRFRADLGLACDPDADRLAMVNEKGEPIGEEATLALAVRFVMARTVGKVVINMSTSRMTADEAVAAGGKVIYTPVGEANVIEGMKRYQAVIGGEGNGGVILPACHYGRDALVAAALVCALMTESKENLSGLAGTLPKYNNIKVKAPLPGDFEGGIKKMERAAYRSFDKLKIDRRDGLRFDFARGWFQIRKSNTEPIFRLIVETDSARLSRNIKNEILSFFK